MMRGIEAEQLKCLQLDILCAVAEFCFTHNIQYYLGYGTLLGAVRHKGDIPWDDDIDIVMLRQDYEKFVHTFNLGRTDSLKVLCYELQPDFPYEFGKVEDTRTKLVEAVENPYDLGVNIDVFPLDNVTDDFQEAIRLNKQLRATRKMVDIKKRLVDHSYAWYKQVLYFVTKTLLRPVSLSKLLGHIQKVIHTHDKERPGKYVAEMGTFYYQEGEILEREWFCGFQMAEFENKLFCVPKDYDAVLKCWYGDYMQLPPAEKRVTHHSFRAYYRD